MTSRFAPIATLVLPSHKGSNSGGRFSGGSPHLRLWRGFRVSITSVADLRVGGFLFTGIGGAVWLLLTPPDQQYGEYGLPAPPLSSIEQWSAGLFLVGCFVWIIYALRGLLRSDRDKGSVFVSLLVLLPATYFTVRGFTRLFEPFSGNGPWVFWKLVLTGCCFMSLSALAGMMAFGKRREQHPR